MTDQDLEGLNQGTVGNVALVLVELACREEAAEWYQGLVDFVDHRGLADAGTAGYQHQLRRAACHHSAESCE